MAYPDGIDNGQCPPTHPHHLISLFYEVWFNVAPINALNDGGRFVLANGDPTGYGLHGDFMDGWDKSVLSRAVATCTNLSGVIDDCHVFSDKINGENRFFSDDENNNCAAPNPIPSEDVNTGVILEYLPGCVPITEGPAPAVDGVTVPGCTVGSVNGSTNPAPPASSGVSSSGAPASGVPSKGVPSNSVPSSGAPPSGVPSKGVPSSSAPSSDSPTGVLAANQSSPVPSASGTSTATSATSSPVVTPTSSADDSPSEFSSLRSHLASLRPKTASSDSVSASTFTTNLGALLNILQGTSSAVPTPSSSVDPDATSSGSSPASSGSGNGGSSGQCGGNTPRNSADSHRRSRMKRRHGTALSN